MSVATKNPFAILDAEDASRPSSPAPAKKAAAPAPPAPPPSRGAPKQRGGPASRGGKYYPRGGAKPSPRDAGALNQNGIEEPQTEGRKFDGRGRGGRGGRGGARGGRGRPFDKHSQTGKVDSEKKVHQSWGGDDGNTELKAEEAAVTDAANDWGGAGDAAANVDAWGSADAPAADGAASPAAEGEKGDRSGRPPRKEREPEEEDNTLTFDQYLAQKKEKEDLLVPKLENTRIANEGADGNIWKDVVPLEKSEEDSYFVGKAKAAPKARAKKEDKVFIEIEGRFERPSRGGRGGRGGPDRGRGAPRGRGGPRGGRSNGSAAAPAVNVDDEAAFPSLS